MLDAGREGRLQTWQICNRCGAPSPSALLAIRLGARPRCQRILRQYRLGAAALCGSSSYELSVGVALRRTLAEGSGADGGWQRRAAHGRNSSGWGRQPRLGESISALCVRYVDDENLSSHPVRPLRGLQVGAASGEDEDRLLQGCEPAW